MNDKGRGCTTNFGVPAVGTRRATVGNPWCPQHGREKLSASPIILSRNQRPFKNLSEIPSGEASPKDMNGQRREHPRNPSSCHRFPPGGPTPDAEARDRPRQQGRWRRFPAWETLARTRSNANLRKNRATGPRSRRGSSRSMRGHSCRRVGRSAISTRWSRGGPPPPCSCTAWRGHRTPSG